MASSTLPFYVEISRKEEGSTITLLGYDVIARRGDTSEVVKHFSADGCGMEKASEAAWDFAIMAANAWDMMKARDDGMCVARETLRVGEVFKGAAPAGEAAGYARGTGRNAMFMDGFLEVLHQIAPHGIRTDAAGTITELVTALPKPRRRRA